MLNTPAYSSYGSYGEGREADTEKAIANLKLLWKCLLEKKRRGNINIAPEWPCMQSCKSLSGGTSLRSGAGGARMRKR